MPIRFVFMCAACLAAGATTSAQRQPSGPDYRASLVCGAVLHESRTARLVVHAVDVTGEPLPGSDVWVKRDQTVLKTARTDAAGRAVLDGLPAGTVFLQVDLEGFKSVRIAALRLQQNCITAISVPLDLGILGDP